MPKNSLKLKTIKKVKKKKFFNYKLFFYIFLFTFLIPASFFALISNKVQAESNPNPVNLYFFYGQGCPHCADEEEFFKNILEPEFENLTVHRFEVWYDKDNQKLLKKVTDNLEIKGNSVPITIIDGKAIYGYQNDASTGKTIEKAVLYCSDKKNECQDPIKEILDQQSSQGVIEKIKSEQGGPTSDLPESDKIPESVKVPIFGEVEIKTLSLPALSVTLGTLDGFNPCAMWVLLFLISLLLKMKNIFRRWVLGIAFILASGFVYFIFMSAWLNFFIFIGYVIWVRVLIGVVAIGTGGYNIREYFINKNATCKVTGNKKRQKTFDKLRKITASKSFWVALIGIVLLAFAVNLVELLCSLGLPAIFTNVLTLSNIPSYQYYLYILLYLFFFMLDDMIVFGVAMITVKAFGLDSKYSRYSTLIGGIIILIIGVLMLLKPEWLMFG